MNLRRSISAHSPEILIGFGLAGMIVAVTQAVKATPKAMKLREEELRTQKIEESLETDISPTLQKVRVIKAVLPAYVPTIIIMAASAACIIGGSATSLRRNAALAAALHVSEATVTNYQTKAKDLLGEEKAKELRKAVIEDDIRNNVKEPSKTQPSNGLIRCYNSFEGKEFWSSEEKLRAAALELNEDLFEEDYVTLNDFYYKLDIRPTELGNRLVWDLNDKRFKNIGRKTRIIELIFDAVLIDGVPYLAVSFKIPPSYME